ncbi:MAG: carbamoyltransferase [Caldilineaceae bacterium]|nr:carbamoyltransferase [Caldilineaceae bacterium]
MYVLGISCYYHDAAAALLHNGQLVAAADEERFSRIKHDADFPRLAIDFCLAQAGITPDALDYVVFYEKPLQKFERILLSTLSGAPRTAKLFREAMATWFSEKLWIKSHLLGKLNISAKKLLFVEHHLTHAASAFFCSPFKEAAILTIDGVGEWTTTALGRATADWGDGGRNSIQLEQEIRFPHSLGLLYSAFTAWLGFQVNNGEYKVMGMSPYGEPRYLDRVEKVLRLADDGSFALNMDYFSFHTSTSNTYNRRFVELFGEPRDPKADFITDLTHPNGAGNPDRAVRARNQHYADVAMSIQRTTEEAILRMAHHLRKSTGSENLCIAGGVALNSMANGRLVREGPFKNVYIQPSAGDSGGALGAALYAWHVLLGKPRSFVMEHAYWGAEYSPAQIGDFLGAKGLPFREVADDRLLDELVDDLTDGRVIGWFQGRFEWGPRALGNRSILADPRSEAMKEIVNEKIKFREPFRPFAPAVLEERAADYYTTPRLDENLMARYMLLVSPVHPQRWDEVPAVTHMGSGRLQTVRRSWNPRYYDLIARFGQATGTPVLLNTSFNLRGEPIVTTPENAFNTFVGSDIDVLVLGNCILRKRDMGGRWEPAFKGAMGE